ncbi:hypothetical protein ACOMHN_034832 [Nucella lapillus]
MAAAAQRVMNMATVFQSLRIPDNARPIRVELPPPPALTGALTPNNWLAKAQRLAFRSVQGPESIAIDRHGTLYTGLKNGLVVAVRPNGQVRGLQRMALPSCRPGARRGGRARALREEDCGRPLGMRLDPRGFLVFADAYSGIFKMDKRNGRFGQLVNSRRQRVEGQPLGFLSDLAILKDGTIFFTSSSTKWSHAQRLNILLEGEKSGRLLMFSPRMRGSLRLQQVLGGLSFPNGLQLSTNEDYLLIAESARARIYRIWLRADSPRRGDPEVFADNLPGFVENIRLSPRNTYWVGLSNVRHSAKPSLLDSFGSRPDLRRRIMGLPKEVLRSRMPQYGLVVELNEDGKIIRGLHDPTGALFPSVSEVKEFQGKLYIASPDRDYIGVLSVNSLPPPVKPGPASTPDRPSPRPQPQPVPQPQPRPNPNSNPNPNPTSKPKLDSNSAKPGHSKPTSGDWNLGSLLDDRDGKTPVVQMLAQINLRMDKMNGGELRDMVLVILKQVIETKKEASKTLHTAIRLKSDMTKMKTMLGLNDDNPAASASEAQRLITVSTLSTEAHHGLYSVNRGTKAHHGLYSVNRGTKVHHSLYSVNRGTKGHHGLYSVNRGTKTHHGLYSVNRGTKANCGLYSVN